MLYEQYFKLYLCPMPTIEELEEYFNSVEIPQTIKFDR